MPSSSATAAAPSIDALSTTHWGGLSVTGQTLLFTTLLASMFYLFGRRRRTQQARQQPFSQDEPQSIESQDSPGTYKCALLKDRPEPFIERYFPDVKTLWDAFQRGLKKSEHAPCLGWRPIKGGGQYKFITYGEVAERSRLLGAMLINKLQLKPTNDTFVAIYSQNCSEWIITALACIRHSMVVVPLYDTLGPDAATYILSHIGTKLVVVDEVARLENVLSMKERTPELAHIILVNRPGEQEKWKEIQQKVAEAGLELHILEDLIANAGQEGEEQADHEPKPDDNYIVCYTSGTTGTPKGVLLSHKNVVANISAIILLFEKFLPDLLARHDHSLISYLPLSHMFEQGCHWASLSLGFRIGYFSGNVAKLSADMQALQPTLFPVVPRLLNRFNDTIKSELARSSPLKQWIFALAKSQKTALLRKGIVTNNTMWDRLVFAKAQQQLGGKVQLIVTGSAPIAAEILEELRVAFGTQIVEGYGQTEATCLATCTWPGEVKGGHCGGPAACSILKLADVPEMNYFASEGKGEVMLKGPSVTKGYYKDPEKTAELFDEDGFLHTGDIGHIQTNGTLRIVDRKKHIFKLAQGEYVAPEKIENIYIQCSLIQQIYVDGDSLERYLVAIVVPPEKLLRHHFAELCGGDADESMTSFGEICADKRMVRAVMAEMERMGKQGGLNSIEQVKVIQLEPMPFSVENGLLTPTLKAKRPELRKKYSEAIKRMYKEKEGGR